MTHFDLGKEIKQAKKRDETILAIREQKPGAQDPDILDNPVLEIQCGPDDIESDIATKLLKEIQTTLDTPIDETLGTSTVATEKWLASELALKQAQEPIICIYNLEKTDTELRSQIIEILSAIYEHNQIHLVFHTEEQNPAITSQFNAVAKQDKLSSGNSITK